MPLRHVTFKYALIVCLITMAAFFSSANLSRADIQSDIAARQKQIEEIQKQIDEYQSQIDSSRTQSLTLQNEISNLNAKINQIALTIRSLQLSINQASAEIVDTEGQITDAEAKIETHKAALAQFLKIVYENDQKTLTEIILKNDNLSDFFNAVNSLRVNQDNLKSNIDEIKALKQSLEQHQSDLEDKKTEYQKTQSLEALEKSSLDQNKNVKNKLLKDTKGQEAKFQDLVKKSQKDIEAIKAQIGYLIQNGVSVEDAIKFGNLAAIATGIRPAFLIAELEVESGIGINVGKCNRAGDPPEKSYKVIMKPTRDIQPFLTITSQLGLNTDTTAVSCPQFSRGVQYGWGGAMGPAQFLPSTWLGYAEQVAQIVRRAIANPWNIEDAFTGAAVKLARGGATDKTKAAEIAASKAYYSGNPRCSSAPCNSYANVVQRTAAEIEKNL